MKRFNQRSARGAIALALAGATMFTLSACGSKAEDTVSVQSVAMLMGVDLSGVNSYTGVVEAETVQKIARDASKTVEECLVAVGDEVKAGDVLFTYDMDALSLSLETAQLEIDQLSNSITSADTQIAQLEKEKKSASASDQLSYTLQIQTAQNEQAQDQYNMKVKQAELDKLKESASVTQVTAPISGVIQAISDEDTASYITIQQTDAYRVKGTANELNVGSLYEGEEVTIRSRISDETWLGTVSEIDTGMTESDESADSMMYDYGSSGESASKYSFYVELNESDALMMGQHVYIVPGEAVDSDTIVLPSGYFVDMNGSEASVWAAGSGDKLEKRSVELGGYDEDTDCYEVLSGLTMDDYIAFPDTGMKAGTAVTYYSEDSFVVDEGDYAYDESYDEYSEDGEDGYYDEDGNYWYYDGSGYVDPDGNFVSADEIEVAAE